MISFIEPFQQYLSPFGAIGEISKTINDEFDSGIMSHISSIKRMAGEKLSDSIGGFLDILLNPQLIDMIGLDEISSENVPNISLDALKRFFDKAGWMEGRVQILFNAFEKLDKFDIAEGVITAIMLSASAFLTIESLKGLAFGGNSTALAVANMVNSVIALIATIAGSSIGDLLFGFVMTTISCFSAFFGFIFSALSKNVPALLTNLAFMPGSWAAYGLSAAL